jgi:type 1 glutamine amidotransferase
MGGMGGMGGMAEVGPYAPRSGKFKMLVYSKTAAFRHDGSIVTGKALLNTIASDIGIDPPTVTETNDWLANIDDYELLFFMNPTGDIFNEQEQGIFETWMKKGGAWCGTHSATDTENGWAFYSEVTGQYYDGHGSQNVQDQIQFEASALNPMFPALAGLPNPWSRAEEWYKFNNHQVWSAKEGFKILGRKAADGQPIIWTRQYQNFRSFYTAIGHDGTVFQDPDVKKHLIGGIMWTVRREHCLAAATAPKVCP